MDDLDTIKDIIADKTGVPKQFLPKFKGMEDNNDDVVTTSSKKKLSEFNIGENSTIEMESMTLYVDNETDPNNRICIDDVDPFNDTIDDIKEKIATKLGESKFPVHKQRLMFGDDDLDDDEDSSDNDDEEDDEDDDNENSHDPPSKRKLFEWNIKNFDTLKLEKAKIKIKIKHPNEDDVFTLKNVDPRKATLRTVQRFLSKKYYLGKDRDGSIKKPKEQLRPLRYKGKHMKEAKKSLRDYGFIDDTGDSDDAMIVMEPMVVKVIPPGADESKAMKQIRGSSCNQFNFEFVE